MRIAASSCDLPSWTSLFKTMAVNCLKDSEVQGTKSDRQKSNVLL